MALLFATFVAAQPGAAQEAQEVPGVPSAPEVSPVEPAPPPGSSEAQPVPEAPRPAEPPAMCPPPPETTGQILVELPGGRSFFTGDEALVRDVEESLLAAGFLPGARDGRVDPQLLIALVDFQRWKGLPVTANLDRRTARALGLDWARVSGARGAA